MHRQNNNNDKTRIFKMANRLKQDNVDVVENVLKMLKCVVENVLEMMIES